MNVKKAKALRRELKKVYGDLKGVDYEVLKNKPLYITGEAGMKQFAGHGNGTIVCKSPGRKMYQQLKKGL